MACQRINIEKNIQNIGRATKLDTFQFFIFAFSFDRKRKRDSDEYDVYDSSSDNQESKCCEKTIRINRLDILLTCLLGLVIILSVTLGVIFGIESNKEEISDEFRYDFILTFHLLFITRALQIRMN